MHVPQSRSSLRHRSGFSFIEITVVVLILAIMAAVAMPRMTSQVSRYRAKAIANRIAADLRLAKRTAKARGKAETVTFDPASNRYSLSSAKLTQHGEAYSVSLAESPYNGQLAEVSFGDSNAITFSGRGFPFESGYVDVSSGDAKRRVVVDSASGRIEVEGS